MGLEYTELQKHNFHVLEHIRDSNVSVLWHSNISTPHFFKVLLKSVRQYTLTVFSRKFLLWWRWGIISFPFPQFSHSQTEQIDLWTQGDHCDRAKSPLLNSSLFELTSMSWKCPDSSTSFGEDTGTHPHHKLWPTHWFPCFPQVQNAWFLVNVNFCQCHWFITDSSTKLWLLSLSGMLNLTFYWHLNVSSDMI
jgi:hypothetical protein